MSIGRKKKKKGHSNFNAIGQKRKERINKKNYVGKKRKKRYFKFDMKIIRKSSMWDKKEGYISLI